MEKAQLSNQANITHLKTMPLSQKSYSLIVLIFFGIILYFPLLIWLFQIFQTLFSIER